MQSLTQRSLSKVPDSVFLFYEELTWSKSSDILELSNILRTLSNEEQISATSSTPAALSV